MGFPFFLAIRFLRGSQQEKALSVMIKVCFMSIFIAVASLTLIAAIMNGFEKETYKKLQGIHADLTLSGRNKPLQYGKLVSVIEKEFPEVIAISPTSYGQVLLSHNEQTQICLMKITIFKNISLCCECQCMNRD